MPDVRLVALEGIPEVEPGADLAGLLGAAIERAGGLETGDVLVVAQKVVSKAEGRVERTDDHLATVLREARAVRRRRGDLVIAETEHGFVCASSGAPGDGGRRMSRSALRVSRRSSTCAAKSTGAGMSSQPRRSRSRISWPRRPGS